MMENREKIVESFELTSIKDKYNYDTFYLKRTTKGKEADLGKANLGKFYNDIWNLGEDKYDPERYISVLKRMGYYVCWLKIDEKSYQVKVPLELPADIVFRERDEYVKTSWGRWERKDTYSSISEREINNYE